MSLVELDFKFPDWGAKLRAREDELNRFTAAMVQTNRGMMFDKEGAHNGRPKWAPLRLRNGQILSNRGALRKSLAPANPRGAPGPDGIVRFAGDLIVFGTKVGYARLMNDGTAKMPGGVLRAKNANALKIPLPSGQNATVATRKLRAVTLWERVSAAEAAIAKVAEKAARARQRFQKSGSDAHLTSSVNSEFRLANAKERLQRLRTRAQKVGATGRGGETFIFRKSVKIPPRDFTSWNQADQDEVDGALIAKVIEVLNG